MRSYVMSWGTRAYGRVKVPFDTVEGFHCGLDLATADAEISARVFEVDIWDTQTRLDHPFMMQVLVGHATRTRILLHEEAGSRYAVGDLPTSTDAPLTYERPTGTNTAETETTTVPVSQARGILTEYVRTGEPPTQVTWAVQTED
ncbi:hypothetical protein GCM10010413_36970 [Promicromonospora sukumoe]|uniref:Uncharacterized protein n=1 Tax=Promicromonospora sukumoe TaxID=88382 RepID=A0A7W3J7C2_9MICO|nr:Imm1 family immunity protein [Promicromonospora sukumoe]MBA8807637.1 hypothetical protein [Promicromonospora sukumoe]